MCDFVDENFDDYHKNRGMKFSHLFLLATYQFKPYLVLLESCGSIRRKGMFSMNNEDIEDIEDHDELWATKLEENMGVIFTEINFWAP